MYAIWFAVNLVERNTAPNGYQLLNPNYVGKHDAFDLITLATEIQNADVAVNNHSGKLSLILDQVRWSFLILSQNLNFKCPFKYIRVPYTQIQLKNKPIQFFFRFDFCNRKLIKYYGTLKRMWIYIKLLVISRKFRAKHTIYIKGNPGNVTLVCYRHK